MKRAFKTKWEALFIIFKGLSFKQIKPTLLEGECPTLRLRVWQLFKYEP